MTYAKYFDNMDYLIVLKINTVIFIFIRKKFINVLAKNII